MTLLYLYAAVSFVLVVAATIDILRPVISEYELETDLKVTYYVVFIGMGMLTAPILLYPIFSRKGQEEFKTALHKTLFVKN